MRLWTPVRRFGAAVLLIAGPLTGSAMAQTAPVPGPAQASSAPPPAAPPPPATLTVLNRPIMEFRGFMLGSAPDERVRLAQERISETLARGGPGLVTTLTVGDVIAVQLDGRFAFAVAPGDANPLDAQSQSELTTRAVAALERVVTESRESRDSRARLVGAGRGLLYLVIATVIILILAGLRRAVSVRVARFAEIRASRIKLGGTAFMTGGSAGRIAARALGALHGIVIFLIVYETIGFILREFPYTRPWGEQMDGYLVQLIVGAANGIAKATPGLLVIGVIYLLASTLSGAGRVFFDRVREGKVAVHWLGPDLAQPTQRLFGLAVWLFALAMAYPYFPGSGSAAFDGVSVLVGLMVSLGGASAVGQAIAGLSLMYQRTIRVGDYVRIDDVQGTVLTLGTMQTRIRTGAGDEVILANSRIIGAVVRNYTRPSRGGGAVLHVTVTIGYDAPWRQIHGLLLKAAHETAGVGVVREPFVLQTALSDFYVEYKLVCEAAPSEIPPLVQSRLHANVQDAFNQAGVQIMSPHYRGDPASPKVVPPKDWDPPLPKTTSTS